MAEIMIHPFFQRKHTTEGSAARVVEPPRLEQVARPVRSESDIDKDILRNLRTLWSGCTEEAIVDALLTQE